MKKHIIFRNGTAMGLWGAFLIFTGIMASTNFAQAEVKKPWLPTPELIANGKRLFTMNCTPCHGPNGEGNGPAAIALNPKPRNFTQVSGWKNGRKPSQIFKTLKTGLGSMPSFAQLPMDDRWSLTHFIESLAPAAEKDSDDDLKKIGVDPTKDTMESFDSKTLPIDLAIELMSQGQ